MTNTIQSPVGRLGGLQVVVCAPIFVANRKCSADLPLPEDFRDKMNAWLLKKYGGKIVEPVPRGQTKVCESMNTVLVHPADYAEIRDRLKAANLK